MDLFKGLRKTNILIIDDDKWIRNSLAMFFEEEGCLIAVSETAEEGLEELKNQDYRTIIADYRLPGMDGLEFFRRIQESHRNTLRMLVTAYGNQKIIAEAEAIGVGAVIHKPFTVEIIKESLLRLMRTDSRKSFDTSIKKRKAIR
jgi:DNA-binding NtrC family response regulator